MQFIAAFLIGTAGLAFAAPTSENTTKLTRRIAPTSNCGLDIYQSATEREVAKASANLQYSEAIKLTPNGCVDVYCGGKTSVGVCAGELDPTKLFVDADVIAAEMSSTFRDCYARDAMNSKGAVPAFQYWGDGYNILVKGGAEC